MTKEAQTEKRIQRLESQVRVLGEGVLVAHRTDKRLAQGLDDLRLLLDLRHAADELDRLAAEVRGMGPKP